MHEILHAFIHSFIHMYIIQTYVLLTYYMLSKETHDGGTVKSKTALILILPAPLFCFFLPCITQTLLRSVRDW